MSHNTATFFHSQVRLNGSLKATLECVWAALDSGAQATGNHREAAVFFTQNQQIAFQSLLSDFESNQSAKRLTTRDFEQT